MQRRAVLPETPRLHVLYTGGTFGCVGQPLAPLAASVFVPILQRHLPALYAADWQIQQLEPALDSSQMTPAHWLLIAQHCLALYQQDQAPIIVVHGTDTLAYTAAFLAEVFAGSDIRLCVTGSQRPLLQSLADDHAPTEQIHASTDAFDNLRTALQAVLQAPAGVSVAFAGEHWPAQTCQKIHSQDLAAFTGHHRAGYPAHSYHPLRTSQRQQWIEQASQRLDHLQHTLSQTVLSVYYATPQPSTQLLAQLTDLVARRPDSLIVMGYGSGNFPYSPELEQLLGSAIQHGCMLVIATQVPFGGTDSRYASGHWLSALGALPSARLTLPAIYARLYWICATEDDPAQRHKRWMQCLNDTRASKR